MKTPKLHVSSILVTSAIGFLIVLLVGWLWPLPEQLLEASDQSPLQITDRQGKMLYEVRQETFGAQDHLSFESIPEQAISALISIEDHRFYYHWGVDPIGVLRALWQNFQADKIVSGGSTITQQLVRNRLQPVSRDYWYKMQEMFWAIKLEGKVSKEEILEDYLNAAYFGQQAYGLHAASNTFFDKSPNELSTAETAFLIGLIQSPSGYNPYQYFDRAKQRQLTVLKAMKEYGDLSTAQYEEAQLESLRLVKPHIAIKAPHFVFWVLEQLGKNGEELSTRQVTTTLDLDLQTEIERIVDNELSKLQEQNVISAAVVVLDVHTGEVLSMLGSADYFDDVHDGQVNVAVSSRQPGSALKPFTYALALAQGDTAATTIADIEAQFLTQEGNPYIPRNYDYSYHGLVRYREALANSYNIPAVKVAEKVGVPKLLNFLQQAGLSTLTNTAEFYGVALTLGSGEVRLLELAQAYGVFPRGGRTFPIEFLLKHSPSPTDAPLDFTRGAKSRGSETKGDHILDSKIAWLVTDILSDNQARTPEFGEDSPLAFDRPVAAKTGTTRNSRDNWTIGYTPDHIVGVWVGNADNSPMIDTSGITGAGPIFHGVMEAVNKNIPPKHFQRPAGLVQQRICKLSGKLPSPYCPHSIQEWFVSGTEPRQQDDMYTTQLIDSRNGLLAHSNCDPQFLEEKVFVKFPGELQKWARENGYPTPPKEYSPFCIPPPSIVDGQEPQTINHRAISITRPHQGDSFQLDPLIPDEDEQIIFEAQASEAVESLTWFVDDQLMGTAQAPDFRLKWKPKIGKHQISVKNDNCKTESCQIPSVWIEVVDNAILPAADPQ